MCSGFRLLISPWAYAEETTCCAKQSIRSSFGARRRSRLSSEVIGYLFWNQRNRHGAVEVKQVCACTSE